MIDPKTQMKINLAVRDYERMFPEENKQLLKQIESQRQNLSNEMAELSKTHVIKRALYTISENLAQMIALKMTELERIEFSTKDSQRWFAETFPQYRLTKKV